MESAQRRFSIRFLAHDDELVDGLGLVAKRFARTTVERPAETFFETKGLSNYGHRYNVDGKQFGNDHAAGFVAMNAVASLAATNPRSREFVEALWHTPVPAEPWRCYDGMLYLLAMLHCSGEFKVCNPQ